jgi:hypothetical protein
VCYSPRYHDHPWQLLLLQHACAAPPAAAGLLLGQQQQQHQRQCLQWLLGLAGVMMRLRHPQEGRAAGKSSSKQCSSSEDSQGREQTTAKDT